MKVLTVSYTDSLSGSGIAAMRVHRALGAAGLTAKIAVMEKRSADGEALSLGGSLTRAAFHLRQLAAGIVFRAAGAPRNAVLSANLFPTGLHRIINAQAADLVHLHWIGGEMLRIEEVPLIRAPIVWTLHDEWFNLGIEHYAPSTRRGARCESLDRWTRKRKARSWRSSGLTVVTPSRWLAEKVAQAGIVPETDVRAIPNPVPLSVFRPMDRRRARAQLGLPQDLKIIGFGAIGGIEDPRKGFGSLKMALDDLASSRADAHLLVFGGHTGPSMPFPASYAGIVREDAALALHYAAMDVFVCPSWQENLPNTIAEALACGTPCAAFRIGGIPELILHRRNGYLAQPYEPSDLARGILDCLDEAHNRSYRSAARVFAEESLAPSIIAARYVEAYAYAMRYRKASGEAISDASRSSVEG